MKMERYYYTEYKKMAEQQAKDIQKNLRLQQETIQRFSEKEQNELRERQEKAVNKLLSEMIPSTPEVCTIINPVKHDRFFALAQESISLAQKLRANLLVHTENMTGCITFVGEEFSHIGERKDMLEKLITAADEVHIALSADTGDGSPTDVDSAVRVEFWFDFYAEAEME